MPEEMKEIRVKIEKRVKRFIGFIERLGIEPHEVPAIVDAGFGVVENIVAAGKDGRLSITEVSRIWTSIQEFRNVWDRVTAPETADEG